MKRKKQKNGISLIVLVITIIVMIILAATIIISLNNNGIIDKASEAVDKTNEKQVEELASLAWADAYAENVGKSNEELLQALKTSVEKALSDNNLDKEDYGMEVTTTGVTIVKGWLQKANRTVVKGSTTLNIGDYVNYVSGVSGYTDTNGWQVLGAENGELLIMSASDVKSDYILGSSSNMSVPLDAYENGISYLNEICAPYGKGAYATKARSITVEDVDRVTGYDKTTYGKGTIQEYGNIVTYTYNGTTKPTYSGSNGVTGTIGLEHSSGFHWFDLNNVYHNVSENDLTSNTSGVITADGVEAKVKSTYYCYGVDNNTNLDKVTDAYKMLFGDNAYWLASSSSCPIDNDIGWLCPAFGLMKVSSGWVGLGVMFHSVNSSMINPGAPDGYGVRAVVHLSSDLVFTGSSTSGWSIE